MQYTHTHKDMYIYKYIGSNLASKVRAIKYTK